MTYELSSLLSVEGKLYKDEGGRWTYLMPKSLNPNYEYLHGEGAMYVDMQTLKVERVEWFRY